jgi:hypothetical protein
MDTEIRVSPSESRPTHDVSFENLATGEKVGLAIKGKGAPINPTAMQRNPMRRVALKTSSGELEYSDYDEPWFPNAQSTWYGGRGSEIFEDDKSKFYDNHHTNTTLDHVMLGPLERVTKGLRSQDFYLPTESFEWISILNDSTKYIADSFVASDTYDAEYLEFYVRKYKDPVEDLTIKIIEDSSGPLGSELFSDTISPSDLEDSGSTKYRIALSTVPLTSSSTYWVLFYSPSGKSDECWEIGCELTSGAKKSTDGSTWADATKSLFFRVMDSGDDNSIIFFDLRYAKYCLKNPLTGAPEVYINGDRGAADANTGNLDTLVDATKSWTTDEFVGAIVMVISGTGVAEDKRFRKITANDGTTLTVDRDWLIEHDTTTEYVIIGADTWREVTGHGITAPVTNIFTANEVVYFCQGQSVNVRKGTFTSGAHAWKNDGTNKYDALYIVYDPIDDVMVLGVKNGVTPEVFKASPVSWGANHSFSSIYTFKDNYGHVNNIIGYGSPELPYIIREGHVFYYSDSKMAKLQLDELSSVMEYNNGRAACTSNVYLVFSIGASIQQYYSSELVDIGYNRGVGLPSNRRGLPNLIMSYPGKIFAANDASPDGYSSIMVKSGNGWSELYRANYIGEKIDSMIFCPSFGTTPDKMFVALGSDVIWLYFPSSAESPDNDSNMRYINEGYVESPWMYLKQYDMEKLWHSISLFSENLTDDGINVRFEYKLDSDDDWSRVISEFEDSPTQKEVISEEYVAVNGRRFKYRAYISTNDLSITPKILAVVIEAVGRLGVKWGYSFDVTIEDEDVNSVARPDKLYIAKDKWELLDSWADGLTALKMRSTYKQYDDKYVFIDPTPSSPAKKHAESYVHKIIATEF